MIVVLDTFNWLMEKKAAYKEGFVSVVINSLLFIAKYYVGLIHGSIAILADAFHTLSDSLTSIILVLGYKVADKPPDKEHPFGHGRAEFIGGLVIGVLLCVVAYEFGVESYERLVTRLSLLYSDYIVAVLGISAIVKGLLALWAYRLSLMYSSHSIKADSLHHLSDTFASCLITVALYLGRDYWWLDGLLGLGVSILILYTAIRVIYDTSSELLGKGPSSFELDKLMKLLNEVYPMAHRIHHVHFHRYGKHIEVTLHIDLPGNMTLKEAHEVATLIENAIRRELGYEVTVHLEPGEHVENHVD